LASKEYRKCSKAGVRRLPGAKRCQAFQNASTLMSMDTLPIINRAYDVYKAVTELIEHLPKRQRYALGESIEKSVLACMEQLIMAKNAPKPLKAPYLLQASCHLEILTLKLRLLLERKLCAASTVFKIQEATAEVGRMLGGWLKSLNAP
jgi:hypothetical protein